MKSNLFLSHFLMFVLALLTGLTWHNYKETWLYLPDQRVGIIFTFVVFYGVVFIWCYCLNRDAITTAKKRGIDSIYPNKAVNMADRIDFAE